jgi:hypothetical protein
MRNASLGRLGVVCSNCETVIALPASRTPGRGGESISITCPTCAHDGLYSRTEVGTLVSSKQLEWKEPWLVRLWRWLCAAA